MKVGWRTFNSSHQIYHRRRRWAMELIAAVGPEQLSPTFLKYISNYFTGELCSLFKFCKWISVALSNYHLIHATAILKEILFLNDNLFPSPIQKYAFRFSYLFFLLNLICDIFSLFLSIILSNNLLTELDIDRLGIYYKTFQCFIMPFTVAPTYVMPLSVVLT